MLTEIQKRFLEDVDRDVLSAGISDIGDTLQHIDMEAGRLGIPKETLKEKMSRVFDSLYDIGFETRACLVSRHYGGLPKVNGSGFYPRNVC